MTGESAPSGAPCIYVAMNIAEDSSGEWYVAPSLITGGRNTSSVSSVSSVSPTLHFPPHVQCMLTTCGCIDDVITFFRYRAKVKLQDLVLFATLTDGIYASGVGHLVRACIARDTFR